MSAQARIPEGLGSHLFYISRRRLLPPVMATSLNSNLPSDQPGTVNWVIKLVENIIDCNNRSARYLLYERTGRMTMKTRLMLLKTLESWRTHILSTTLQQTQTRIWTRRYGKLRGCSPSDINMSSSYSIPGTAKILLQCLHCYYLELVQPFPLHRPHSSLPCTSSSGRQVILKAIGQHHYRRLEGLFKTEKHDMQLPVNGFLGQKIRRGRNIHQVAEELEGHPRPDAQKKGSAVWVRLENVRLLMRSLI